MAELTNLARGDSIPYDPTEDPLEGRVPYDEVRIEGIPPLAPDHDSTAQQDTAASHGQAASRHELTEQESQLIKRLNEMKLEVHDGLFTFMEWFEDSRRLDFAFDVNRLVRFVICRNVSYHAISYLRNRWGVDLARRDSLGRSAIFYALWPYPDSTMLTHIASYFREEKIPIDVKHRDGKRQTLLYYAVKLGCVDATELLLAMNPDMKPELNDDIKLVDWYGSEEAVNLCHNALWIKVLFAYDKLLEILVEHRGGFHFYGFYALGELFEPRIRIPHTPNRKDEIVWLHFPWMTGAVFFSFMRRCGREGTRSIRTVATQSTQFLNIIFNPYTDSFYISNIEAVWDRPKDYWDGQVYIVFPCPVLRHSTFHFGAKKAMKLKKTRSVHYFSNSVLRPERTLDETYFPSFSAENLETRDRSQVVSREYGGNKEARKPILTVPHLWIWKLGRSIFTTYSAGNAVRTYGEEEALGSLVQKSRRPGVQIGLIIAHHISNFGSQEACNDLTNTRSISECWGLCS